MKFELNDYHRNTTDEELIDDVKNTAMRLNKQTLTAKEYSENGRFHSTTLYKRFGTWKRVLELCGLKTKGHNFSWYRKGIYFTRFSESFRNIYGR